MSEDKDTYPKIAIVGAGCIGTTDALATILAEKGLSMSDIIIIKSNDIEEIKEQLKSVPKDKVVLIEEFNVLMQKPIELPEEKVFIIKNHRMDMPREVFIEAYHNAKRFGGHKPNRNMKLRRR